MSLLRFLNRENAARTPQERHGERAAVPHIDESGVTEKRIDPGAAAKLTEARLKRWIDSVGTVTLPLLAGCSITAVVVSDDAAHFLLPGVTILVLAFAALALIVAVQCAYHAHVYFSRAAP